ncbi:MAG: hypothetical protein B6244_01730 [Candidatus Cloacimonetes bacterium 4572_55]|nr:MAG: hypothetical protein B6244_01730 [Candidatus Cloacimonetes bacterium 4572_55]
MKRNLFITMLLLFVYVAPLRAGSISGTVTYDDYQFGQVIIVMAFGDEFSLDNVGTAVLFLGPGDFSITDLADGEYQLAVAVKTSLEMTIVPGEVFSMYDDNPVAIENGQDVAGINLVARSETIQGTVIYEGDSSGSIVAVAFNQDFSQGLFPSNLNQLDAPGAYQMVGFSPGSYYIGAFMDANGNLLPEPMEEPFTIYAHPDSLMPSPVPVDEGAVVEGIDLLLEDLPLSSATGTIVWEGEPTGPIVIAAMTNPEEFSSAQRLSFTLESGEYRVWVEPGLYYIFAFVDLNGNFFPDITVDATGFYGASDPQLVAVSEGETVTGIDISLAIQPNGIESPELTSETGIFITQNHPNPFFVGSNGTVISYILPKSTVIDLSVYDVSGRRIVTLDHGWRPTTTQTVRWDGQDERGESVADGVYLYQIKSSEWSRARRLVLLKK